MAKLRNEAETFQQRVIPLAKQKFNLNLTDYATLQKCALLLKDIFQICHEFRRQGTLQATTLFNLLKQHQVILTPLIGFSIEYIIANIPSDKVLREFVSSKLDGVLKAVTVSFRFALVFVFLYQCYELYNINKSIKEAMGLIKDEEIEKKFREIEKNLKRLKEIADEVDHLVELWQLEEDPFEKRQLWQLVNLTLDTATNKEYRETCRTITDLRAKVQEQAESLEKANQTATKSGLLSSLGLFSFLVIDLVPVVGAIATVTSIIGTTVALKLKSEIKKKLERVQENLEALAKYDDELEEVMLRIRANQDWLADHEEIL